MLGEKSSEVPHYSIVWVRSHSGCFQKQDQKQVKCTFRLFDNKSAYMIHDQLLKRLLTNNIRERLLESDLTLDIQSKEN